MKETWEGTFQKEHKGHKCGEFVKKKGKQGDGRKGRVTKSHSTWTLSTLSTCCHYDCTAP